MHGRASRVRRVALWVIPAVATSTGCIRGLSWIGARLSTTRHVVVTLRQQSHNKNDDNVVGVLSPQVDELLASLGKDAKSIAKRDELPPRLQAARSFLKMFKGVVGSKLRSIGSSCKQRSRRLRSIGNSRRQRSSLNPVHQELESGIHVLTSQARRLELLFRAADPHNNRVISRSDSIAVGIARGVFAALDEDDNGFVDQLEWVQRLHAVRRSELLFQEADRNKDGFLDKSEAAAAGITGDAFDALDWKSKGVIEQEEWADRLEKLDMIAAQLQDTRNIDAPPSKAKADAVRLAKWSKLVIDQLLMMRWRHVAKDPAFMEKCGVLAANPCLEESWVRGSWTQLARENTKLARSGQGSEVEDEEFLMERWRTRASDNVLKSKWRHVARDARLMGKWKNLAIDHVLMAKSNATDSWLEGSWLRENWRDFARPQATAYQKDLSGETEALMANWRILAMNHVFMEKWRLVARNPQLIATWKTLAAEPWLEERRQQPSIPPDPVFVAKWKNFVMDSWIQGSWLRENWMHFVI